MEKRRQIILYGNSLILESIGISLGVYSHLEVIKLVPPLQEKQKLGAVNTDIILFDLETTHPEAVLSLLEINSALQLIGVSSDINLVKIWSTRELREVSIVDLLKVITSETNESPVEIDDHEDRRH